jgi:hypothetical protein
MRKDEIRIEILEDGAIKVETDGISGENHTRADLIMKELARLFGGETTVEKRRDHAALAARHTHTHTHTHKHSH